jgi:hypothetical protein
VRHTRTLRAGSLLAAAVLGLAACGDGADEPADPPPATDDGTAADDDEPDPDVDDDPEPDPDPDEDVDGEPDDVGEPDDDAPEEGEGEDVPPLDIEETTGESEAVQSSGARLTLTDVRVGTHDGFDRVTLELGGEGAAGWFTSVSEEAQNHGRGDTVELDGSHALTVALRGIELPPERDGDVDPYVPEDAGEDRPRIDAPAGSAVLTEVVVGTVFEGQKQVFLGLDDEVAYRITRFEDPERVVIDLVHP